MQKGSGECMRMGAECHRCRDDLQSHEVMYESEGRVMNIMLMSMVMACESYKVRIRKREEGRKTIRYPRAYHSKAQERKDPVLRARGRLAASGA